MPTLRRITSSGRFIPQIDGLRFLAILSVILLHLWGSLTHNGAVASPYSLTAPNWLDLPKRGVELFFAISGFILAMPFKSGPVSLKAYFLRRLTRLEPPYILALVLYMAMLVAARQGTVMFFLPHLLAGMTYTHALIYGTDNPINGVTWSLEIEVQFYLLMPLLAGVFNVQGRRLRRAVLLTAIGLSAFFSIPLYHTYFGATIFYYAPFFLAGILAADIYVSSRRSGQAQRAPSLCWDAVALLGWPLVWLPMTPELEHVLMPFLLPLLMLSAFRGRIMSQLLSFRWITNIGGMCYSIYLLHFRLISLVDHFTKPMHIGKSFVGYLSLQALLVIPPVLAVCTVYFLLVERPCMARNWPQTLRDKLRSRYRQVAVTPQ